MAAAVIEGVRAVPQVMVIFWVFFTLPIAFGQSLSPLNAARVSLTLFIAAYLAEFVRARSRSPVACSDKQAGEFVDGESSLSNE